MGYTGDTKANGKNQPLLDDTTQQLAVSAAKNAGGMVAGWAEEGVSMIGKYVEQGPDGVRVLAFLGGLSSMILSLITLINPLAIISFPIQYIYTAFIFFFALISMLLECDPQWFEKMPVLHEYQEILEDQAKFVLRVRGRGFFFIFQGVMWMMAALSILNILVGMWCVGIGAMYVAMHYGVLPQEFVAVTRRHLVESMQKLQGAVQGEKSAAEP